MKGILADVAPTLLTIMGIPIPEDMTGKVLDLSSLCHLCASSVYSV